MTPAPTIIIILIISLGLVTVYWLGRTCVFSNVKARLLMNGKPVSYAKVRREWDWNKEKSDVSITDENGVVTFPAVYESSVARLLPLEVVISQRLLVEIDGEYKEFWLNSKREPGKNREYGGAAFDVVCELTNEEKLIKSAVGVGKLTVCALNTTSKINY